MARGRATVGARTRATGSSIPLTGQCETASAMLDSTHSPGFWLLRSYNAVGPRVKRTCVGSPSQSPFLFVLVRRPSHNQSPPRCAYQINARTSAHALDRFGAAAWPTEAVVVQVDLSGGCGTLHTEQRLVFCCFLRAAATLIQLTSFYSHRESVESIRTVRLAWM